MKQLFGKPIDKDSYPIYIAEISCNHNGSLAQAKELIHAAKEAGADAVKIQAYTPHDLTIPYLQDGMIKDGPWSGRHLWELYDKTFTPYEWVAELAIYAESLVKIPLFASVFSEDGLWYLEELKFPAYKIASFENNDIELIKSVMQTKKPVLISTGMASVQDINRIIEIVDPENTVLMHCVSSYPTKDNEANLWKIKFLQGFYPITVGFSDHTTGIRASELAVTLGAKVIEKHLMINGTISEDDAFSCTPDEFQDLIAVCSQAWDCVKNSMNDPEASSRQFRRSLYVVSDIEANEAFTANNVRSIRPSWGLEPYRYQEVLTKVAKISIKAGTPIQEYMLK